MQYEEVDNSEVYRAGKKPDLLIHVGCQQEMTSYKEIFS